MKTLVLSMISIAATVAAMTACTSESDEIDNIAKDAKVEIKFGTAITGIESKAAITGTAFEVGKEVGIYALQHKKEVTAVWKETGNFMQNVKGTTGSDGAISTADTYNYPTEDQVDFYAYYPFAEAPTGAEGKVPTINIAVAATDDAQIDYMYATPIQNTSRVSGKQTLQFNHALSLLNIKVQKADGVNETLTLSSIKFSTDKTTATMNIATGAITDATPSIPGNCANATTLSTTLETTCNNPISRFVVLPSSSISNLIVTINDKDYTISDPKITLQAGQQTTFTVTLSAKGIEYGSAINNWGENTDITGEI